MKREGEDGMEWWNPVARRCLEMTLLALVGGWFYLNSGRYASTDNAYVKADKVPISAEVSGTIKEVLVEENQPVTAGWSICTPSTLSTAAPDEAGCVRIWR